MPWSVAISFSVDHIRKRKSVCPHIGDTDFNPFQHSVFQSVDFFPAFCVSLSVWVSLPHLLLSCSLSISLMFILCYFGPGPFGLHSGSVSLYLWSSLVSFLLLLPLPLDFGPASPSSLRSTERCARPLRPATRLTLQLKTGCIFAFLLIIWN